MLRLTVLWPVSNAIWRPIVGLGADIEVERGELDACAVAHGDVQFVAVIFLNDRTGVFCRIRAAGFPNLESG